MHIFRGIWPMKRIRHLLAMSVAVSSFIIAPASWAQNNSIGKASLEQSGPDQVSDQDRLFARQIAIGGRAEVEDNRLAIGKLNVPAFHEFAERMVRDHS